MYPSGIERLRVAYWCGLTDLVHSITTDPSSNLPGLGEAATILPTIDVPGHGTYTRESINLVGVVKNVCGAA